MAAMTSTGIQRLLNVGRCKALTLTLTDDWHAL